MKTTRRTFSGKSDLEAMSTLAQAFPADNLHCIDLPYRFSSWALDNPGNIALWEAASGELLAWAVMQTPFWAIDYACHPAASAELHRQILDWTDRRAAEILDTPNGRPAWFVNVLIDQIERQRDLESAGFACQADVGEDSWSKVFMQRAAQLSLPICPPPGGFTLRPLAGESEVTAYVDLQRAVFESRNMTVEWRARTLNLPEHIPDIDLVAAAPDGRLAAFCICWFNPNIAGEACGQVEPLGVHPDFRKLGLGRAILSEGLRRLHQHGAKQVFVETDNTRDAALQLYQSAGFQVVRDVLVYRKDYEKP
jgi:mycothiol synthase